MNRDYSDAALILMGHGTTLNADSCAPVYQQAAELRRRALFAQVREGFWKQEPHIVSVLRETTQPRIFIVPLFISEGYFTEIVIPRALGLRTEGAYAFARVHHRGSQTLLYCQPVGTHPSMIQVILARANSVVRQYPFPWSPEPKHLALFLAGHGTDKNENSRVAIERQVELIRALGAYAAVEAVFLEEEPRIEVCYQMAPVKDLVMVPFFISDGLHVQEDLPVLLGQPAAVGQDRLRQGQPAWRNPQARHGKRIWLAASVGSDPHLADVILERVKEMA